MFGPNSSKVFEIYLKVNSILFPRWCGPRSMSIFTSFCEVIFFKCTPLEKTVKKKFNFESSISLSHPGSDTSYYRKSSPRTSRTRSGRNSTCKSEEELDIKLPIGSLDGLEETWSSKYRKPLEKLKVIQKSQSQSQLTWDNSLPTLNHSRSWRNLTVDLFFEKNSKET